MSGQGADGALERVDGSGEGCNEVVVCFLGCFLGGLLISKRVLELGTEGVDEFDDLLDLVLIGLGCSAELDEAFEDWSEAWGYFTYGLYV